MAGDGQEANPTTRRRGTGRRVRRPKPDHPKPQPKGSSSIILAQLSGAVNGPDVEFLRKIRLERYNTPSEERRASKRSDMTYISESVIRVPVYKSDVRYVSKRSTSKPRRRHEDHEHTHRRRKVRVAGKAQDDSEYVYRTDRPREVKERSTHVSSGTREDDEHRPGLELKRSTTSWTGSSRCEDNNRKVEVVSRREPMRRQSEPIWRLGTQRGESKSSEQEQGLDKPHRYDSERYASVLMG